MRKFVRLLGVILTGMLFSLLIPGEVVSAMTDGELQASGQRWAALIQRHEGIGDRPICSGVIVDDGWVLTAAHCVHDDSNVTFQNNQLRVVVGRGDGGAGNAGTSYRVADIVLAPGYNPATHENDIALIRLENFEAARWGALPLAFQSDVVYRQDGAKIYGYGHTGIDENGDPVDAGHLFSSPNGSFVQRLDPSSDCRSLSICLYSTRSADDSGATRIMTGDSGAPWLREVNGAIQVIGIQSTVQFQGQNPAIAKATPTLSHLPGGGRTLAEWIHQAAALPDIPRANTIIRNSGTGASWLMGSDGYRHPIPTGGDYVCFERLGSAVESIEMQILIDTIPEASDSPAKCATTQFPISLPSSARTGSIIQSDENHLYVLAGGRLFWFDKNDTAQLDAFRDQARRLTGSDAYIPLHHDAVHALEVNRDPSGNPSPGSNMPADNIFLYEHGSGTQYEIKYGYPFAIGSPEEVIALGGQDKAVMVPKSIADLRRATPRWVRDDLMQFWGDPAVWHYVDQGFRVPSVPTRDCLAVRHNRVVTLLPASARALFPTHPTQQAACDFGHGQWLRGVPSDRQIMVLYNAGHAVQYGEIAPLGGVDRAAAVADETIDGLLARGLTVPDNHVFRAAGQGDAYLSGGGQWHRIGSPGQRDCLLFGNSAVEEVVPASFIGRLPQGTPADCRLGDGAWFYDTSNNQQYLTVFGSAFQVQYGELAPLGGVDKARPISHEGADYLERLNFTIPENEMIKGFGAAVYQVKDGKLQAVGNPAIRDCLTAETGKQVRQVPEDVITRMRALGRVGPDARCALEGKQLLSPNGTSVAWIKDGYRRPVQSPIIRDCIAVRANAGQPLRADEGVWNSYPAGPNAYCPYPASVKFVRGDGQSAAWRVYPDGTRQHISAYCADVDPTRASDPRYKVHVVPAGEVDGHALRNPSVFYASVEACRAIT